MKRPPKLDILFDDNDLVTEIYNAIEYLRSEAYYEQLDLCFRMQACNEEIWADVKQNKLINRCVKLIEDYQENPNNNSFKSMINDIFFRLYPKSLKDDVEKNNNKNGRWISNLRTQKEYHIDKCDLFIELPLELRIIDTLWTVRVGRKLDSMLPVSCYANRFAPQHYRNLFKLYFNQYKKWRDTGLDRAKKCLENHQNVALLSLDISRCYYNIETYWGPIDKKCANDEIDLALTSILKEIQSQYLIVCKPFINDCGISLDSKRKYLLPIGLLSSRVLSNWKLRSWDSKVQDKL